MTNLEKASKLVLAFKTGENDLKGILSDKYVEHNHRHPGERHELEDYIKNVSAEAAKRGGKVRIVRSVVDGPFVALHVVYVNIFINGDLVAFDIFKFEDGLIVEHWDAIQKRAPHNKSGHGMFDGAEKIEDLEKTDFNKKIVAAFFEKVLIEKTDVQSVSKYIHADYIQHNPNAEDTLQGTLQAFQAAAKLGQGLEFKKLHLLIGQGNFVLAASEADHGGKPVAVIDLFRLQNDMIVEHWDVIEPIASGEENKFGTRRF